MLAGFNGDGSAKQWNADEETYLATFDSVATAVCDAVKARAIDVGDGSIQIPQAGGEHGGAADPVVARFAATAFPPQPLEVAIEPTPPPPDAWIEWQRIGAFDRQRVDAPNGRAAFTLAPSDYLLRGGAAGYVSDPKLVKIPLYGALQPQCLRLVREVAAGTAGVAGPAGAPEVSGPSPASQPSLTGAMDRLGVGLGSLAGAGPSSAGVEGIDPSAAFDLHTLKQKPRATAAPPADTPASAPGTGTVRVDCPDPLMALSIAPSGRAAIATGVGHVRADRLVPGIYHIVAAAPDGEAASEDLILDADDIEGATLVPPADATPGLVHALDLAGIANDIGQPDWSRGGAAIELSAQVDPVAAATLGTLALFAVAEAILRLDGKLSSLAFGTAWRSLPAASGLHMIAIDERPNAMLRPQRLQLWQMRHPNSPKATRTALTRRDLPITEAVAVAPPGFYWLEFADADREARAGFKLATAILPGRVTIVMQHMRADGRVDLQQHVVAPVDSPAFTMRALRAGELVQRALSRGRVDLTAPAFAAAARAAMRAPFATVLAAFAAPAPPLGTRDTVADELKQGATEGGLIDSAILAALQIETSGGNAREAWQAVIARAAAPVSANALDVLIAAARRNRIFDVDQRWLLAKRAQAVPHPLWLIRRKGDLRPSSTPRV